MNNMTSVEKFHTQQVIAIYVCNVKLLQHILSLQDGDSKRLTEDHCHLMYKTMRQFN